MPWVETTSPNFAARHELVDDEDVAGVLELLEGTRERLAAAVEAIPTEASAMALRCARGATGETTIRDGRRTVQLTPAGGRVFFFDPQVALRSAARLARAVRDARDLEHAQVILAGMGVRTELTYEREAGQLTAGE